MMFKQIRSNYSDVFAMVGDRRTTIHLGAWDIQVVTSMSNACEIFLPETFGLRAYTEPFLNDAKPHQRQKGSLQTRVVSWY
jgi:hypothetical protein